MGGAQNARRFRIIAQLAAQAADQHIDGAQVGAVDPVRDIGQQPVTIQHQPRIGDQNAQKLEFRAGQGNVQPGRMDGAAVLIAVIVPQNFVSKAAFAAIRSSAASAPPGA